MSKRSPVSLKRFYEILRLCFSRTISLWILCFIFLAIFGTWEEAKTHAIKCAISRLSPDLEYMKMFAKSRTRLDHKELKDAERYYQKVTEYMGPLPEAYGMAGFCQYYEGQKGKASHSYSMAIRFQPNAFSFHYNLGIIFLEQGSYAKAALHFEKAVAIDPGNNLKFVTDTRIYRPFLPKSDSGEELALMIADYTRQIYRRAYLHLFQATEKAGNYHKMFENASKAARSNLPERGVFYYYAGLAAFHLKNYDQAVYHLQEALKQEFAQAEVFNTLGLTLQAMGRKEANSAFLAAASLSKAGKNFVAEKENRDLLIY